MDLRIGARHVGEGAPCLVIAEVGLAHDGSLSQAHAYIEAVARSGADAVKFQCHLGDKATEWRLLPPWPQDEDRQTYWARTGFMAEQWRSLANHCADLGVIFLCSPFSVDAARMLDPLLEAWKLPSGRVTDLALIDTIGRTGKPVLISTGMGTSREIDFAVRRFWDHGCAVGLLQCTTLYPCPPELLGLPLIAKWRGFSDHSGTIYPGIAAAALGCQVLEVHVCFSREAGGFDAEASLTPLDLGDLVAGVRFVERAMKAVDKDEMAGKLTDARRIFMGVPAITEQDIA